MWHAINATCSELPISHQVFYHGNFGSPFPGKTNCNSRYPAFFKFAMLIIRNHYFQYFVPVESFPHRIRPDMTFAADSALKNSYVSIPTGQCRSLSPRKSSCDRSATHSNYCQHWSNLLSRFLPGRCYGELVKPIPHKPPVWKTVGTIRL